MTARDDLDRHVNAWLASDAPTSPPEHLLDDVLARTARTRRRAAWRIPERWIPMSAITSRLATPPGVPWRTIAVAALLIALIAGALLVAGSLRNRVPPPFGPAANGAVYYSVDGDLVLADSPTGVPRTILAGDTNDNNPLVSPDGTRMLFVRGEIASANAELWTAASDGSSPRMLAEAPTIGWAEWSPQSDAVAVLLDSDPSLIRIINATDGSIQEVDTGLLVLQSVAWRPPDGAQLTLRGRDSTTAWGIFVIGRDGTGLQRLDLDPGFKSDPTYTADAWSYFQTPVWSADGTRLLYYGPEPAPGSPAGPGYRIHVAEVDAAGAVTSDRIVEFDASTDDEFEGTWLDGDSILFHTVEGLEHRLFVGSVSEGHGPARDLGMSVNDWIPVSVSPDLRSSIVSLPGATETKRNIV
ncbi:MAG TPA: hypothetical protein VFU17_11505, partial [Candidatus Limnocylindrales bacterium]|nr:hypothetical protein [Candidatus Limnocylindrales bacterium]